MMRKKIMTFFLLGVSIFTLTGCGKRDSSNTNSGTSSSSSGNSTLISVEGAVYSASDLFTTRDLKQEADLDGATTYTLTSGKDITITTEGVYVITGEVSNVTIYVDALDEDKVQIVLDGVSITNDDFPCIYVKNADKVFITTTNSENVLKVEGTFQADGETNTDGVIFSKDDITFNGVGSLTISSTDNGIVGKDDVKITGGTYTITASSKAIEANDSIRISDGVFTLKAGTDALHAENDEDEAVGYIYIGGGQFNVQVGDDGIHATSVLQIDDGDLTISAAEGLEATYIQINGGTIQISASDDGINAANKSSSYSPTVEINGGEITITMGAGDTDAVDSNGNIIINGGTLNVTGNSSFDYDGEGTINGGTVIVNGSEVDTLPNQMMGGGGPGGQGGNPGDQGGNPRGRYR